MYQMSDLERSIYRTIYWFSLFNFPLTSFEIWKWLYAPSKDFDYHDIYLALDESNFLKERLNTKNGYYSISEKDINELISSRHNGFLDATRKFNKLKRVAWFFGIMPGVRAVAAVNNLSWWNTNEYSDIDLFIITRPKTIWSTRFFSVLPFIFFGNRPKFHNKINDPFCFSFFTSANNLCFEFLSLSNEDPYLNYWTKSLIPIIDRNNLFDRFENENIWVNKFLPNSHAFNHHYWLKPKIAPGLLIQGGVIERILQKIQCARFPKQIRDLANKDTRVIISDEMLKFHEGDRREEYKEKFFKL